MIRFPPGIFTIASVSCILLAGPAAGNRDADQSSGDAGGRGPAGVVFIDPIHPPIGHIRNELKDFLLGAALHPQLVIDQAAPDHVVGGLEDLIVDPELLEMLAGPGGPPLVSQRPGASRAPLPAAAIGPFNAGLKSDPLFGFADAGISRADYYDAALTRPIPDGVPVGGATTHLVRVGQHADLFDPDAEPVYRQEFLGGIEFEVARSVSLGVRYVHRAIPAVLVDTTGRATVRDAAEAWFDRAMAAVEQAMTAMARQSRGMPPVVFIAPIYMGEDWIVSKVDRSDPAQAAAFAQGSRQTGERPSLRLEAGLSIGGKQVRFPRPCDACVGPGDGMANGSRAGHWRSVVQTTHPDLTGIPEPLFVAGGDPSSTGLFVPLKGAVARYVPSVVLLPEPGPPAGPPQDIVIVRPAATEPGVVWAGARRWDRLNPDLRLELTAAISMNAIDDAARKMQQEERLREELRALGVPVLEPGAPRP